MFKRSLLYIAIVILLPLAHTYGNTAINESLAYEKKNKIILYLTFPKGGTHLIMKALEMITGRNQKPLPYDAVDAFSINANYFKQSWHAFIFYNHLFSFYDVFANQEHPQLIKLIGIRDPRDVILSTVHWINYIYNNVKNHPMYGPIVIRDFVKLSFADQITKVIEMPEKFGSLHFTENMHVMSKNALLWMKNPSVLTVRFEDLVGPQGGGDLKKQKSTIRTLGEHIGYPLSDILVDFVAASLFGDTPTFRKGQIGAWKEYFTEEHKQLIKETMGNELIELGYEKDNNW